MISSTSRVRWLLALLTSLGTAATPHTVLALDDLVLCDAEDPEILDHVITYQKGSNLYVQRLESMDSQPIGEPLWIDGNLPSAGEALNGPEIGRQSGTGRWFIAYQKAYSGDWALARSVHSCSGSYDDGCWEEGDWPGGAYAQLTSETRWVAFPTVDEPSGQHIAYLFDSNGGHTPSEARLRFRQLTETYQQETPVNEDNGIPRFAGRWITLGGELNFVTTVQVTGGAIRPALVDRETGAVTVLTTQAGTAMEPKLELEPEGSYKLIYRWIPTVNYPQNYVIVLTCEPDASFCQDAVDWSYQTTFTYANLPDNDISRPFLQSFEPFLAQDESAEHLYVAFLAADLAGFSIVTQGKIWYTQIPDEGNVPEPIEVSDSTLATVPKRIEPEVHQAFAGPQILYSQEYTDDFSDPCDPGDAMLLRGLELGLSPPN